MNTPEPNPLGAIPFRPSSITEPLDCTECRAAQSVTSIAERQRRFQRQAAQDRAAGWAALVAIAGFVLAGAWGFASIVLAALEGHQ